MSASDGFVIGSTKVVDHGSATDRWNLVIVAEGYRASEMTKFHTDVINFIDQLYNTPPYDQVWCGINIYRVDVASDESGADNPDCDGEGDGTEVDTYFDASFCRNDAHRLLYGDSALAISVAEAEVPEVDQVLVMVNSPIYGGAGGDAATTSTHPDAAEIAIHEIGHSAFGLADEYDYYYGCGVDDDRDNYPGGEPVQPNVTASEDATGKWDGLIAGGTATPTMENPDCTQCNNGASPVAAGTIGTFEGAYYYHCDAYRPEYNCKMRELGEPFCAVCEQIIIDTLSPYAVPTSVTPTSLSIAFTDIPEGLGGTGVTTYRAIRFDIIACSAVTLEITAGPTGGFGTPLGTSVVVPPGKFTSIAEGRLWLSYTSTNAGDVANGSVTVHCIETDETWIIDITANTVGRPKTAVALLLDRSGSMDDQAGDGNKKVDKLREAATIFVDVMLEGDALGIVRFNQAAQIIMPVTDVGPEGGGPGTGRDTAEGIITGADLTPGGQTSIGDGCEKGKEALDTAQAAAAEPYDVLAMAVLTDGNENTAPWLDDVGDSITANTFAIGFGTPDNVSADALNTLTQENSGYLLITGNLTPDQTFLLQKYFLQILAGITNADIVVDPKGFLVYGQDYKRIPFILTEADYGADIIVLSPVNHAIDFLLETPDGTKIDPAQAAAAVTMQFVQGKRVSYYRISLPALAANAKGTHGGKWHALLRFGKRRPKTPEPTAAANQTIPYNFLVHSYSNLNFKAWLTQSAYMPGTEISLFATLKEYDVPVDDRAQVWAEVTRPDGSETSVGLIESEPGRFEGTFITSLVGVYVFRIRAVGSTFKGSLFSREQTLTAAISRKLTPGGDKDRQIRYWLDAFDKKWTRKTCCLLKALLPELKKKGIDTRGLERCLGDCEY